MGRNVVETIMGALVLLVAGVFTAYAFSASSAGRPGGYELIARFDRIDGVKRGTDVTLAGVKVGTVVTTELDPKSYNALVRLTIDPAVKIPTDSSAKIVTESLLGGTVILLEPGNEEKMHAAGGELQKTQGAISLVELLVKFATGGVSASPSK